MRFQSRTDMVILKVGYFELSREKDDIIDSGLSQ